MTGDKQPSVVVVAIGNPDRGDDGFGPAVASKLRDRTPHGVRILERRGDVLALIEDWNSSPPVVIVDAMTPITKPGRVHRLDLTKSPLPIGCSPRSSHAFGVAETVELARSLGRLPPCLIAYVVEGEQFETGASFSPAVAAVVEDVAERVLAELSAILEIRGNAQHA